MGEITGVNRHLRCAVLDHDVYLWVTSWLDDDGDECDPDDAVACVAGDDEHGWWAIDLTQFSRINVN